jgi:hypothetical protein
MNWSKEHLEARMLDAIEGRLSDDQLIQLRQLLCKHPELGDLDESLIYVNQMDEIEFDHSFILKKESFNPEAYLSEEGSDKEKMSIANMEGILSNGEEKAFEHLLKVDIELKLQWQLVQQTKLIPNEQIHFPSIETLKKAKGKVIPFRLYFSYAAAASIIFLLFLSWPSQETQVKLARKPTQKPTKADQKATKSLVAETNNTIYNLSGQSNNIDAEHVHPEPNDARDCIVQEVYPEVEHSPIAQSNHLTPPMTDPIELAAVNAKSTHSSIASITKYREPIGIRDFVIQKGNEKLFGTAKPSTAEKYKSITNYLAQSVNIPISYHEKEDEEVKTTFFKLGFITVERKQTKK